MIGGICSFAGRNARNITVFYSNLINLTVKYYFAAKGTYFIRKSLPKLPRAELWVIILLN